MVRLSTTKTTKILPPPAPKILVIQYVINPWHTCTATVTVVFLCVCVSVCLWMLISTLQTTKRPMNNSNGFSTVCTRSDDFTKTTAFEIEKSGQSWTCFLTQCLSISGKHAYYTQVHGCMRRSQRTCP